MVGCERCAAVYHRLELLHERVAALVPLPAAAQLEPGLLERGLQKTTDAIASLKQYATHTGGQAKQQLADAAGQAKQHAAASYTPRGRVHAAGERAPGRGRHRDRRLPGARRRRRQLLRRQERQPDQRAGRDRPAAARPKPAQDAGAQPASEQPPDPPRARPPRRPRPRRPRPSRHRPRPGARSRRRRSAARRTAAAGADAAGGPVRRAHHPRPGQPGDRHAFRAASPAGARAAVRRRRPVRTMTPKGAPMRSTDLVRIAPARPPWLRAHLRCWRGAPGAAAGTYTVYVVRRAPASQARRSASSRPRDAVEAGLHIPRAAPPTLRRGLVTSNVIRSGGSSAAPSPALCSTPRRDHASSSSSGPARRATRLPLCAAGIRAAARRLAAG